jgi:hypothetical protein
VAQEVAPFDIEFTVMDVYADTPAGEMRRAVATGTLPLKGDPLKMAREMIDSADRGPAPRRLTLGSTAYTSIGAALAARLAALDAQRDIALATDVVA